MSAFMCGTDHIDILTYLALYGATDKAEPWEPITWSAKPYDQCETLDEWSDACRQARFEEAEQIGTMLTRANVASLVARYGDDPTEYDDPDTYAYPYRVQHPRLIPTTVEALKAVRCFEYQACEVPKWRDTEAYSFCESLTARLQHSLQGYNGAPWEWRQPALSITR